MIHCGIYQHYKGQQYQVLHLARHSETQEEMVVYKQLYGDGGIWVRPAKMFAEKILIEGEIVDRFRFLGDEAENC